MASRSNVSLLAKLMRAFASVGPSASNLCPPNETVMFQILSRWEIQMKGLSSVFIHTPLRFGHGISSNPKNRLLLDLDFGLVIEPIRVVIVHDVSDNRLQKRNDSEIKSGLRGYIREG
jgi:hypothetical protein